MRISLIAVMFGCLAISGCSPNNIRPHEIYSSEKGYPGAGLFSLCWSRQNTVEQLSKPDCVQVAK